MYNIALAISVRAVGQFNASMFGASKQKQVEALVANRVRTALAGIANLAREDEGLRSVGEITVQLVERTAKPAFK